MSAFDSRSPDPIQHPLDYLESQADWWAEAAPSIWDGARDAFEDVVNPNGHGQPDPAAVQAAFGHYADHTHDHDTDQQKADEAAQKDDDRRALERFKADHPGASDFDIASKRIGLEHDNAVPPGESAAVGDLSTAEGRTAALAQITQNRTDLEPLGEHECGAASLVGGALLAGGNKGLGVLADDILNKDLQSDPSKQSVEELIDEQKMLVMKAKLLAGVPLTQGDIHSMDDALYRTIKLHEEGMSPELLKSALQDGDGAGISARNLQGFIDHNPDLAKMFKANHMDVALINSTGERDPETHQRLTNHFVLEVNGKSGEAGVYDPYSRRGGQVANSEDDIKDYNDATVTRVGPGYSQ